MCRPGMRHFWTNDKKPYLCKRLTGTEVEDSTLIARVKAGDRGAFNELYGIYWASLVNYAGLFVGDDGAEDVVQEVFVNLWNGTAVFENEKALTVYLYRSVTNNALKYLRDRNTEEARLRLWSEVEREMSEEDFSSVVREEVLRKLRELIDLLPGERRKVILMSMDGMSGEEIAAKLGVTIHTVKQQKYLAYKFIKQELGKYWIVAMLFFL